MFVCELNFVMQGAIQLGIPGAPASGKDCTTSQEMDSPTTHLINHMRPN